MDSSEYGQILDHKTLITSKTDCKGNIIYCNHDFLLYSGYSEEELLTKPHNIIRHPDMPRTVFKLLWDTIQAGQEIFAFVKNRAKHGGCYWVFANVTPSWNHQKQIIGYYSVRRRPSLKALDVIIPLYEALLKVEQQHGMKEGEIFLLDKIASFNKSYNHLIYELQGKG